MIAEAQVMIVVMDANSTEEDVEAIQNHLRSLGLSGHLSQGVERTVIGVVGQIFPELKERLEVMSGVREVVRISRPYKLSSREFKSQDTVIRVGDVEIGGDNEPVIMAGPCAVESEEQVLTTARAVKAAGAKVLRGGAFKPRTSPYSFRGMGVEGLKILARAREETGLPIITEVLSIKDVDVVAEYADILQIGARNMQNFNLLDEVGGTNKPVMLKRGLSATYEGLAAGLGVCPVQRQQAGHSLRKRRSHLRDLYPQYLRHKRDTRDTQGEPPPGCGGPQPRNGKVVPGRPRGRRLHSRGRPRTAD